MEPDKDELLSHRILRVEREPVSWNKEEVWRRINDEIQPARSRWYYVAAAATILLMLGSYFTVDNAAKIVREQEVIIGYQPESKEVTSEPSEVGQPLPLQRSVTPNKRERKTQQALPENNLSEIREAAIDIGTVKQQKNEGIDSTSLSRQPIVAETETQEQAEERIRPVIGVIYSNTPAPAMANNKRRKKLYKLDQHETESWTPPLSNTLILARKK